MGISKDDSVSHYQHSHLPQDPVNCDLLDISANLPHLNNANFNRTTLLKRKLMQ